MKARQRALTRAAVAALFALLAAYTLILAAVTPRPVPVDVATSSVATDDNVRRSGSSWARRRGGMLQVYLHGTPQRIGAAHARLLRPHMVANERALWSVFEELVPTALLRTVIIDAARIRFAGLSESIGYARRAELSAAAQAFRPDPFEERFPTYARFLMLNALYDVSLSFEHSPLIGCSSVFVRDDADGPLLGRNFDFEAHPIFDRDKAVIVFDEPGKIPVLSVAWPGLAGVVTGLNGEGVGAVVHGARAGEPTASGQPVLITLREALAHASNAEQVAAWLADREPIVSHMILVADAAGASLVVERVPGRAAHVRRGNARLALSNHLEGPDAEDAANHRVRQSTSTLARRARLDELLGRPDPIGARGVLSILRDRRAAGGQVLPSGDRRAIDADIATHGVVMNLRTRTIWVSQGTRLAGAFVRFDLARWLDDPDAESRRVGWEAL
ncbi:MAG: C45 family autoproteolytic acyltransferase/hydrolase [Myxococcota bacterium]